MKYRKSPWLWLFLLLFALTGALVITGCDQAVKPTGNDTEVLEPEDTPAGTIPETGLEETSVILYYANQKYIQTGDESLERWMPAYQTTVQAKPGEAMAAVIEALKKTPDQPGYATLVPAGLSVHSVKLVDGTAMVDLSSVNLNGSSLQEAFLIDQIVESLIASFPEIKQVQFLVDGKIVESLMGHIDATKPFVSKMK